VSLSVSQDIKIKMPTLPEVRFDSTEVKNEIERHKHILNLYNCWVDVFAFSEQGVSL